MKRPIDRTSEPAALKLRTTDISIPHEHAWLYGELCHAPDVRGLAVVLRPAGGPFIHSREQTVAHTLQHAGFATLLINLLTAYEEERDPDARYNVPLMAQRVESVAEWIRHQPPLEGLAVGLVASGTACGAAVRAAARNGEQFAAVVCRGGRPDLAGLTPLNTMPLPVRVVVGSLDPHTGMIRQAFEHFHGPRDWQVVEGADENFEATATLARFGELAAEWLQRHLPLPVIRAGTDPQGTTGDDPAARDPL